MRECLDSLRLMSLGITNIVTVSIVSLPMWQKTKAEMCVHHECVCLCWQSYRKPDVRIFLCTLYTEQCLSVQIMFPIHKVYISLMGGSEELRLCCTLLTAQCLQTLVPANYRNRHAKFKSLLQTIFHISMRSPYKCEWSKCKTGQRLKVHYAVCCVTLATADTKPAKITCNLSMR